MPLCVLNDKDEQGITTYVIDLVGLVCKLRA